MLSHAWPAVLPLSVVCWLMAVGRARDRRWNVYFWLVVSIGMALLAGYRYQLIPFFSGIGFGGGIALLAVGSFLLWILALKRASNDHEESAVFLGLPLLALLVQGSHLVIG